MKLSRRRRYWLKWNGPRWGVDPKERRYAKANMGHGSKDVRVASTAYMCRDRMFFPETWEELHRMAGVAVKKRKDHPHA